MKDDVAEELDVTAMIDTCEPFIREALAPASFRNRDVNRSGIAGGSQLSEDGSMTMRTRISPEVQERAVAPSSPSAMSVSCTYPRDESGWPAQGCSLKNHFGKYLPKYCTTPEFVGRVLLYKW